VEIGAVQCFTAPDSSFAIDVQNLNGREVKAVVKMYYNKLTIQSIQTIQGV